MDKRFWIDFRLVEAKFGLSTLNEHLRLVEEQVVNVKESEKQKFEEEMKKYGLTPDDDEWGYHWDEYARKTYFVIPFVLRGSFLVSLYALYEMTVKEVASLIQNRKGQKISIDDIRGNDFLERAKKYYRYILLEFELCNNGQVWEKLRRLAELRHAVAHVTGRLEMVNKGKRRKIKRWIREDIGIEDHYGYIVLSESYLRDTFEAVKSSLDYLIERYKEFDNANKPSRQANRR